MITERTLRKWRKEALELDRLVLGEETDTTIALSKDMAIHICWMLLKMTQELLDQHLLRREK